VFIIADGQGITIPSVFVSGSTGAMLAQFNKRLKYTCCLTFINLC